AADAARETGVAFAKPREGLGRGQHSRAAQSDRPSKCFTAIASRSTPSRQRTLIAAVSTPCGLVPAANGWMPHVRQKRCSIACLLNVYVASASSGVSSDSAARGTNQSNDPFRPQIEQLHASASPSSPSTSNLTAPQ